MGEEGEREQRRKEAANSFTRLAVYSHRGIKWQIGLGSRQLPRPIATSPLVETLFLNLHEDRTNRKRELGHGGRDKLIFDAPKANRGGPLSSPFPQEMS